MRFKMKAFSGEAFRATPEAIGDKSLWPDWLKELWAEPFEAANTVMELNRGHLVLKGEAGIQAVAPYDWIVHLDNGNTFAASDLVFSAIIGRAV